MNPLTEQYILDHFDQMAKDQAHLIRLLQLTKNDKNGIIQDLRRSIIKYVNESEIYIANIELENFEIACRLIETENLYRRHLAELRRLF